VTRASIIELARSKGYEVKEEPVAVTDAMEVRGGGVIKGKGYPIQSNAGGVGHRIVLVGCSSGRQRR